MTRSGGGGLARGWFGPGRLFRPRGRDRTPRRLRRWRRFGRLVLHGTGGPADAGALACRRFPALDIALRPTTLVRRYGAAAGVGVLVAVVTHAHGLFLPLAAGVAGGQVRRSRALRLLPMDRR